MQQFTIQSTVILICTLVFSCYVYASGTATRSPINVVGDTDIATVNDGEVIDLNPNRNVVFTNAGYNSVTSVNVDTTNGILHVYTSYDLAQDRTYSSISEVGGSTVSGIFAVNTFLVGPANASNSETVNITIKMVLDGSFLINNGSPTLLLSGDVVATRFNPLLPLAGTIYQSNLNFLSSAINVPKNSVTTLFKSSEAPFAGESTEYDGASAEIVSSILGDLNTVISLTIPVTVGDSLLLSGVILAAATAEPDPANDGDILNDILVLAATGEIEFSNTASLQVFLPEGYSLGGNDPLLDNIVVTSPPPPPGATPSATVVIPVILWLMNSDDL